MGIFDRFRSTGQTVPVSNEHEPKAHTVEQDVLRLIDEGHILEAEGRIEEALLRYLEAIRLEPSSARAHLNHGNALLSKGDLEGALSAYRTAIKHKPDYAGAYYNIGNALLGNRQFDNAVKEYQRALEIKPDYADVHCSMGVALTELGRIDDAVASYARALEINPDLVEAHTNIGNALLSIGQVDEAIKSYHRALQINPDSAEAHNNLGLALEDLGQLESSADCYRRALEIKPDFAKAHNNLGLTLQGLGQFDGAVASYRQALKISPELTEAHSNLLFSLNYTASRTPSHFLEEVRQFGRIATERAVGRFSAWQCAPQPERLRVGLVSGDLLGHPVGFFLEGVLAHIDSARIELMAYSTHYKEDELTSRIRPYFSVWRSLFGKNDETAARLIHADGVHVLLDLSGHTRHNRLPMFAWKPAPVQASWLGYFATTGVAEMDYLLADEVGVPEALREQFTETIWQMPNTRLCFTPPKVDLPVAPLPALSNGMITFGCFQNLSKVGNGVLEVWGNIFAALPDARLRLQCKQLGEPGQLEQMLKRLQDHGIDARRVVTHGVTDRKAYLAAHGDVDIVLDTFPYPGGTTTCEALWMGVPTLTLAGDSLLARQGASLLTAAGLEEWVASSKEDYIAKAVALASDKPRLITLRADLRQHVLASSLFDAQRFAKDFEDAVWGMWTSHTFG